MNSEFVSMVALHKTSYVVRSVNNDKQPKESFMRRNQ